MWKLIAAFVAADGAVYVYDHRIAAMAGLIGVLSLFVSIFFLND